MFLLQSVPAIAPLPSVSASRVKAGTGFDLLGAWPRELCLLAPIFVGQHVPPVPHIDDEADICLPLHYSHLQYLGRNGCKLEPKCC